MLNFIIDKFGSSLEKVKEAQSSHF